ncbi:hypothetical protein ABW21_db0209067 [Orbilia brochopaga]|nr:hypothetical protein ABW21_db0209067 [Drechslerella brochopaga]
MPCNQYPNLPLDELVDDIARRNYLNRDVGYQVDMVLVILHGRDHLNANMRLYDAMLREKDADRAPTLHDRIRAAQHNPKDGNRQRKTKTKRELAQEAAELERLRVKIYAQLDPGPSPLHDKYGPPARLGTAAAIEAS